MNINAIIKAALDPFGDPVVSGEYVKQPGAPDPERYYSFNATTYGADYADDAPGHEIALVQVHFFCARSFDSVARVIATKQALFAAGLSWPEVMNASEPPGQHIVFECKYLKGVLD